MEITATDLRVNPSASVEPQPPPPLHSEPSEPRLPRQLYGGGGGGGGGGPPVRPIQGLKRRSSFGSNAEFVQPPQPPPD